MAIQIDKILAFSGNKYEKTAAMIKYARYLAQKHDESLEVPLNRHVKDKVTTISINDILSGKVTYTIEPLPEEK